MARHKRPLGLTLVAIGKLVKTVVLCAVGAAALAMQGRDPPAVLAAWADALRIDPGNTYLHRAIAAVSGVGERKLALIGVGTFAYAAVFAVEGVGLWLEKRWAEYLTIAITTSLIPFEIYEIVHRASGAKVVTLVLNVAAVVYLVARLVRARRGGRGSIANWLARLRRPRYWRRAT